MDKYSTPIPYFAVFSKTSDSPKDKQTVKNAAFDQKMVII